MRSLPIVWKRLVRDGHTCDRCAETRVEVERAVVVLERALRPLGIQPELVATEIDPVSFEQNPAESNRIIIAGRPIEEWLQGRVGGSPCCSVCGGADCRTVEVGGAIFEMIPERLILKAGLLAAAELLDEVPIAQGEHWRLDMS